MKKNISAILRLLKRDVGETNSVVLYSEPFKVLISTVLSQRTRDSNTAIASKQLFAKYWTAGQLAHAPLKEIEKLIRPAGFYKVKAENIKKISKEIIERFGGAVPKEREHLMSLRGVGQKTSGIVIVYGFGLAEAIPADTHVHRISNRLGIVHTRQPKKTELALMKIIPRRHWIELNGLLVKFGQRRCTPIKPKCGECLLRGYCEYYGKNIKRS